MKYTLKVMLRKKVTLDLDFGVDPLTFYYYKTPCECLYVSKHFSKKEAFIIYFMDLRSFCRSRSGVFRTASRSEGVNNIRVIWCVRRKAHNSSGS